MSVKIIREVIRIDLEDYIRGLKENPGYIDGSKTFPESSESRGLYAYRTVEEAEAETDRTLHLEITESEAVIEYERIAADEWDEECNLPEDVAFREAVFEGVSYPIGDDLYSEDCYEAILKSLGMTAEAGTEEE